MNTLAMTITEYGKTQNKTQDTKPKLCEVPYATSISKLALSSIVVLDKRGCETGLCELLTNELVSFV